MMEGVHFFLPNYHNETTYLLQGYKGAALCFYELL